MKLTYKQKMLLKKEDNYAFLRKTDYPPIHEQLDMIYWDMENGTTIWRDTIRDIKQRYIKPGRVVMSIQKKKPTRRKKK